MASTHKSLTFKDFFYYLSIHRQTLFKPNISLKVKYIHFYILSVGPIAADGLHVNAHITTIHMLILNIFEQTNL